MAIEQACLDLLLENRTCSATRRTRPGFVLAGIMATTSWVLRPVVFKLVVVVHKRRFSIAV